MDVVKRLLIILNGDAIERINMEKDGTPEERNFMADCLKKTREQHKKADEIAYMIIVMVMTVLILLVACGKKAHAYTPEDMVKAVIGEAEGESQEGKEAIACAINNRGTLKGVYGLHAPRVVKHLYGMGTYENAVVAVGMAQDQEYCESLIHGAQYWGSLRYDKKWIKRMKANIHYIHTATIGNQSFYRKD